MAKAKVKSTINLQKLINKRIVGAVAGDKALKKIDENFRQTIRSGKLLDGSSIKSLAPSTVEFRRRYSAINRTGRGFSPAKSNLTFTGQFLESLRTAVENVKDKVIISVAPQGIHKGIRKIRGGVTKAVSNQELGQFLIDGGRDWTKVGPKKVKEIKRIILEIIRRAVRRI